MKYYWWRYRSVLVMAAMLLGAFFFISTTVGVLDRVMARKAPPAPTEAYTPPNNAPNMARPPVAPARNANRPASDSGQVAKQP